MGLGRGWEELRCSEEVRLGVHGKEEQQGGRGGRKCALEERRCRLQSPEHGCLLGFQM